MKKILCMGLIGVLGGALVGYGLVPMPLLLIGGAQTGVLAALFTWAGEKLSPQVGLKFGWRLDKMSISTVIGVGFLSAALIAFLEKLVFAERLGLTQRYEFSGLYLAKSLVYGGVIEELMLRYGIMTLLVWLIWKVAKKPTGSAVYWIGIFVSALLFAAGHLPAALQQLGANETVIYRTLLLNALPGVGYGYLYWKHGLAASMTAHMATHLFNQLLLLPILFA